MDTRRASACASWEPPPELPHSRHLLGALTTTALPTKLYKMPAVSFQAILDKALADYCEQIGVELDKHPFADELRGRDSPDDVLKLLEEKANKFRAYRDGNRKLIDWLSPVVKVVHTLSGVLGEAVSLISSIRPLDFFISRLPASVQTSKSDLCWRRCSHHGESLESFH